jgi:RNA polymerase sigma-70 factor (ECF subfamily)
MLAIYFSLIDSEDDKQRFEMLYRKLHKIVYTTAFRITEQKEDAEDAAQNVWMYTAKNFKRITRLQEIELKPYFVTMAKHSALNILRSKNNTSTVSIDDISLEDLSCGTDSLNDTPEAKLASYILTLPEIYRQVLELKYIFGFKNREIAKLLNMSQSGIESRILRGRKLLIDKINEVL